MRADLGQLRERWDRLCRAVAATPSSSPSRDVFDRLLAAYTAPDRHYHDLGHIDECLRELDSVRELARDATAVEAAIWFHDVVYEGRRKDNEERSADLAEGELERLDASDAFRTEVRRLILLTRHDAAPAADDIDGQLIVDIDLSSLARLPEEFDANTRLIRQEYPHVPDEAFRRGRRDLLASFLARPRIYYTDTFFTRYESAARANLERALARLGEGTD
jgi:predicted metal-dependent HD superfamily phosphohydrolase